MPMYKSIKIYIYIRCVVFFVKDAGEVNGFWKRKRLIWRDKKRLAFSNPWNLLETMGKKSQHTLG